MGMKIMVVDDDPASLKLVSKFLEKCGFDVRAHDRVPAALAEIRRDPLDVVVTDKNMPHPEGGNEGGMQVLRIARETQPQCQVIMMTGFASVETALEAVRLGAFDYIQKPFELADLKQKILRIGEFQSLIDADQSFSIYSELQQAVLTLAKPETLDDEQATRHALQSIQAKTDLFFRAQRGWERVLLQQRERLGQAAALADELLDMLAPESAAYKVAEKLHRIAIRRL